MKKALFKYFLFLGFLCFSGLVSANTISTNNVSRISNLKKNVKVFENHTDAIKQNFEISIASFEHILEIKTTEIEVEESFNYQSKKIGQSNASISFAIAMSLPFHIYQKNLVLTKPFNFLIPNKRYITFQVFRI